jgi:hypothetical protein
LHKPAVPENKEAITAFLKISLERIRSITRQELKELSADDKRTIKSLIKELNEIIGNPR